jgi:N-acetylglucosamine kinase-like BadF-type ATPase
MSPSLIMMSAKRHDGLPVLGVDIGATWIRVAVLDVDGRLAVTIRKATGVPDLRKFLLTAARRATSRPRGGHRGRGVAALVVASRGIWTMPERRRLARRLRGVAAHIEVISDAQAALLGALGDRAGVLVLAGTGSIVLACDARERWARAGGLGPLLGDEGSGFWLGREWLRATTSGEDFMPARRLVQAPDAVTRIAALAPGVLRRARRGDARARAIVREAARHLAAQVVDVTRQLRFGSPVAVSWAGSLMSDARYRAAVARALSRAGVRARWIAPRHAPVVAAVRRAARLAGRPA